MAVTVEWKGKQEGRVGTVCFVSQLRFWSSPAGASAKRAVVLEVLDSSVRPFSVLPDRLHRLPPGTTHAAQTRDK